MTEPPGPKTPPRSTRASAELLTTVLVAGAATMTIEILGTRVIAPVFGVNLFVWTALISVTLASLATGYLLGGILVDRSPTRKLLSGLMSAAGTLLAITPACSALLSPCSTPF